MLTNKIISFILIILLLFSLFLTYDTNADTILDDDIDATFDIFILSGTELKINVNANVKKITLDANGRSYEKDEIIKIQENTSEIMGAIKYAFKNSLTNQIKVIFNKSDIHSLNELPTFNNGIFYDEYLINLTSNFFKMDNKVTASDFINGLLDMGAIVNYSFNLIAESGWNNTFNFVLPDSLGYHRTTGIVDNNIIQWYISNNDIKMYSKTADISIKSNNPTSDYKKEDIELEFELDCNYNMNPILNLSIITNSINTEKLLELPNFITNLNYIPSDGIRLFIDNYLTTWDDFYNKIIQYFIEDVKTKIEESSYNETLNFSFKWDINSTVNCSNSFEINNMDNQPPIKAIFSDKNFKLLIHGISANTYFGLINSGAKSNISSLNINFGNNFDNIGYPYIIILKLPDDIYINNKNIYFWNKSNIILGNITSDIAEEYTEESMNTTIDIIFKTTDLNILSLFTGDTKLTFGLFINEIQNRNVTLLPDYFKLPDNIYLKFYNSDVLRLCIDQNIFTNETIHSLLSSETELFEERIKNIFNEKNVIGTFDNKKFEESLLWDNNIEKMDDDYPIIISSYSNIAISIPFSFSLFPPSLNIVNQNFTFTGIENHSIKYKLIFPRNLDIILLNNSNRVKINKSFNDNYIIEIYFNKDQSSLDEPLYFSIKPSYLFIFSLFTPCIITLLITILLVIIIYILKRKRRIKRGDFIGETKVGSNAHEEQDYYVPPPPPSK